MASFYFISILLWKITKPKSVWTGNADFLQVLPVDFSRVETVVLPAPVIVGIRTRNISARLSPSGVGLWWLSSIAFASCSASVALLRNKASPSVS